MKIVIADEDAFSTEEQSKLEKAGFFVIRKKFGRSVEVLDFSRLNDESMPEMEAGVIHKGWLMRVC